MKKKRGFARGVILAGILLLISACGSTDVDTAQDTPKEREILGLFSGSTVDLSVSPAPKAVTPAGLGLLTDMTQKTLRGTQFSSNPKENAIKSNFSVSDGQALEMKCSYLSDNPKIIQCMQKGYLGNEFSPPIYKTNIVTTLYFDELDSSKSTGKGKADVTYYLAEYQYKDQCNRSVKVTGQATCDLDFVISGANDYLFSGLCNTSNTNGKNVEMIVDGKSYKVGFDLKIKIDSNAETVDGIMSLDDKFYKYTDLNTTKDQCSGN